MFPPMNELVGFQTVARRLSFKRASDELNLTPSTLSHLVRSLEERLKTRLLNRTTRSVSLTDSGQKLVRELDSIFAHLNAALSSADIGQSKPSGTVRISVNESSAPTLLKRLGKKFSDDFPDIHVELIVENRLVDIVSEGFDAGVRLRDAVPKDMVAVPIIEDFRFVMVASPLYLKSSGLPKKPSDLSAHNCIGFRFQNGRTYEWEFSSRGRKTSSAVSGSITTNSPRLIIDAAKNGLGIAYVAEPLISDDLKSGHLTTVLKGWERDWPGLYLYYPRNRHMPTALRATVNALRG